MYYTDYHCHSILSMDGRAPLEVMAEHMVQEGIQEMCLTDHFDLLDGAARRCYAQDLDWSAALEQFHKTIPKFAGRLKLKLGLEYGMGHIDPAVSEQILALPELDFVIGSVHNLSPEEGGADLYFQDMSTPDACHWILDHYFDSMEKLVKSDYYDSLGHIIYPLRYMNGLVSIEPYLDRVEGLLRTVIQKGKCVEVNTCRGRTVEDWRPILKRYRALGGEGITVGSDAHNPRQAGFGIAQAYDLLRELGFSYVCTYEKRNPSFIQI